MSTATSVVVAAWLVAAAVGCSEFAMRSYNGKYQMSARTLDFQVAFDARVRGLKQGSAIKLPATCPKCKPNMLHSKYDIVGTVTSLDYENSYLDGMNSGGLSIGMLFDDGVQPVPNMTGTRPAIPFMYVGSFILANFKTVAEVQAAMKPELLELTRSWATPEIEILFMPLHIGINDATGATAVLELEGAAGHYVVRANPLRTLTNSPNLPLHEKYFDDYVADKALVPPYVPENLDAMFPGHDVKSRYVNVPGDATSASRRIRLALFRQLQEQGGALPHNVSYMGHLPDMVEGWSPNYGGNEWRDLFAMTVNAIQRVVIINGLSEGIKVSMDEMTKPYNPYEQPGAEHTLIMWVRDHTNGVYFWWTHRAQRWQSFDLKSLKQSFLTCLTPLPAVTSSIYDRTAEMNGMGVMISATGAVAPGLCWEPRCPTQIRGLGIRCTCGGERAYRNAEGCSAPLTESQSHEIIHGFPWAKDIAYPVQPMGQKGVLTVQVTSCGNLNPQQCCSTFAIAVRSQQTLLPSAAPVACITADGATLAPSNH